MSPNSTLVNHLPQYLHPTLRQRYQVRRNMLWKFQDLQKKKKPKSNSAGLTKWDCFQYHTLCLDMALRFSEYLSDSLLL